MKNVMLYFGSFNPIHKGHIAIAEYAVEHKLCDEVILIVSPQNPHKAAPELAAELQRFEMAEIACSESRFPEQIKASAVEFILDRPSYTVNTLRYLSENFGNEMRFSILMGGDLIRTLDTWREPQYILDNYPIYVYPRKGEPIDKFADRVTVLDDAPQHNFSSTSVRRTLQTGGDVQSMLCEGVMKYIRQNNLWSAAAYRQRLDQMIESDPENAKYYIERGEWHYRHNEWGAALNDFQRAVKIDPECEAKNYIDLIQEILAFRYKDIYNP